MTRYPPADIEAKAKALDEWSKREEATALCQFCAEHDTYAQRLYEWRDASPDFAETLKIVKNRLAQRLRAKLHDKKNPYNQGLFMADIGFHDRFFHEHTEGLKDAEMARKMQIEEHKAKIQSQVGVTITQETLSQFNSLMTALSLAQSQRKIDDSNKINDAKS